jgi:hypothetical protein
MPNRSIRTRTTAKRRLRTRFAQIFFRAEFGAPSSDFARCKRGRECRQEVIHAAEHKDLRTEEVTISQAFLQFHKDHAHDAATAGHARNGRRSLSERRRADGARKVAPYTFL